MATDERTFKVQCAACEKPFHVRFPLTRPDAEGSGEVAVRCLHCDEEVMITIPRVYIETDALVRGLPSHR